MGRYLYELINEKKELQLKLDNYNNMLDKNFGSEKYFAIKHKQAVSPLENTLKFSIISSSTCPDSVFFPFVKKSETNAICSPKVYVSLFL